MERIFGVKMFGINRVAVMGFKGTLLYYEINEKGMVRQIHEKKCVLRGDEIVDTFDVLATGQIVGITTTPLNQKSAYRMLVYRIDMNAKIDRSWEFNFLDDPENYLPVANRSNFHRIFLNFLFEDAPVIVAFQGNNGGESVSLFVGILDRLEIKQLAYLPEFVQGGFVGADVDFNQVFVLDSLGSVRVINLPAKKK